MASLWAESAVALLVVIGLVWLGALLLFLKRQSLLREAEPGGEQARWLFLRLDFRGRVTTGALVGALVVPLSIAFLNRGATTGGGSTFAALFPDETRTARIVLVIAVTGGVLGGLLGGMTAASRSVGVQIDQGWVQSVLLGSLPLVVTGGDLSQLRAFLAFLPPAALAALVAFVLGAVFRRKVKEGRKVLRAVAAVLYHLPLVVCGASLMHWPLFFAGEVGLLLGGGLGWAVGALAGCVFGPVLLGALLLRSWQASRVAQVLTLLAVLAGMVVTPLWLTWRDGRQGDLLEAYTFKEDGAEYGLPITAVALSPDGKSLWGDLAGVVQLELRQDNKSIYYTTVGSRKDQRLILLDRSLQNARQQLANLERLRPLVRARAGQPTDPSAEQIRKEIERLEKENERVKEDIERLDRQPEKEEKQPRKAGTRVVSVTFSPDGKGALAARQDGSLLVRDVKVGTTLRRLAGCGWVGCAAFAPDGRRVVTGSAWPTSYGAGASPPNAFVTVRALRRHRQRLADLLAAPEAREVDRAVRLWATESGKQVRAFEGHQAPVRAVAFAPTGRRILTAGEDGTMRLWDVASGLEVRRLKGYGSRVLSVAFAPDGTRALSGHADGSVRVWDLENMEELRRLERHRAPVSAVAFAADGRTAFSGGLDKTVRRWDPTTGRQLGICRAVEAIHSLAAAQDGLTVLAGGEDGFLQRWGWPPGGRR